MKHKIKVQQVFKVWREIVIEMEGPEDSCAQDAADAQAGAAAPDYDDPRWVETDRELIDEAVEPA